MFAQLHVDIQVWQIDRSLLTMFRNRDLAALISGPAACPLAVPSVRRPPYLSTKAVQP
jgi:hypothetical protein